MLNWKNKIIYRQEFNLYVEVVMKRCLLLSSACMLMFSLIESLLWIVFFKYLLAGGKNLLYIIVTRKSIHLIYQSYFLHFCKFIYQNLLSVFFSIILLVGLSTTINTQFYLIVLQMLPMQWHQHSNGGSLDCMKYNQ
jgi:hypothetical protein